MDRRALCGHALLRFNHILMMVHETGMCYASASGFALRPGTPWAGYAGSGARTHRGLAFRGGPHEADAAADATEEGGQLLLDGTERQLLDGSPSGLGDGSGSVSGSLVGRDLRSAAEG